MSFHAVVRCLAALCALLLAVGCVSAAVVSPIGSASCNTLGAVQYGNLNSTGQWDDSAVAAAGVTACEVFPSSVIIYYSASTSYITGISVTYGNSATTQHGDVTSDGDNLPCSECTFGDKDVLSVTVYYDAKSSTVYEIVIGYKTSDAVCSCGAPNPSATQGVVAAPGNGWIGAFAGHAEEAMYAFGASAVSSSSSGSPTARPVSRR